MTRSTKGNSTVVRDDMVAAKDKLPFLFIWKILLKWGLK